MITLIGTGHVFDLSNQLNNIFDAKNPDILCVELDNQRYRSLLIKQTEPEKYKETAKKQPFLYRLLADFQESMAEKYGVKPGDEMITTINYSQSHQIPLACIDMDAQKLFKRMLKTMTIREKLKFFFSGIAGVFVKPEKVEAQVESISKNVESYLEVIGEKFPTIKRILIDERNDYMVRNILKLHENYENIIAVMGDGHIPGITDLLKEQGVEPDLIRLKDLKDKPVEPADGSSASFSIQYEQV